MSDMRNMEVNEFVKMIKKKKSVEDSFRDETDKLGWEYTDVLYSFLGIYTIGIYAFDKEKNGKRLFERKGKDGSIIFVRNSSQRLYSNKYIIEKGNFNNFLELNQLKELKVFLKAYYSIGNIIPIWPGGNENRGKFGCYDLPEFYFSKNKIKPWFDFLDYKYDINLKTYIDEKNRGGLNFGEGVSKFLDDIDVEKYTIYLSQITEIINKRKEYLDNKLIESCK